MTTKDLQKQTQGQPATEQQPMPTFTPRVDILDDDEKVTILADMPGINADTLDIDLDKNILTLQGEFQLEAPEGFEQNYAEYRSGNYERVFTLSNEIDRNNIDARMKNGVLTLVLPKSKEAQPRKISVTAG